MQTAEAVRFLHSVLSVCGPGALSGRRRQTGAAGECIWIAQYHAPSTQVDRPTAALA
jgi:hypothetical protein